MRPYLILLLGMLTGCARTTCDGGSCGDEAASPVAGTEDTAPAQPISGEEPVDSPPSNSEPSTDPAPSGSPSATYEGDFVHASGHDMIDPQGRKLLLRTMNLGNWLLLEGYMWHLFPDNGIGVRHRVIEQKVQELLGGAAAQFWENYRRQYITREDLVAIRNMGFNSVRLPINARFLLPENGTSFREEGFADIQHALDLAREVGLYVVIDMHAAPGGQAGKDIDDSPDYCADLFLQPANQGRLVDLWREIARRFAQDPIIAGYDLLNEPIPWRDQLWDKCRPNEEDYWNNLVLALYPLYGRIGNAIREVDPNHMMIVQGAYWGSDMTDSLGAPFDENMAYSFHFYHTPAHPNEIREYVDARAAWNRPIWVGEFGEDSTEHYSNLIRLFEDNNFGWAFWTWKRINSTTGPYSVSYPDNWWVVEDYIVHNQGPPGDWTAQDTFDSLIRNMQFSSLSPNHEIISALSN